jgi:hypothetical protein
VNEAMTDSELYVQYREREVEGKEKCMLRLYEKKERELEERIGKLETQLVSRY